MTPKLLTPQSIFITAISTFILATGNQRLFERIAEAYPLTFDNFPAVVSLTAFFGLGLLAILLLICQGRLGRWLLAFLMFVSSQTAYYMNEYGVVIDTVMFDNIFQTNVSEMLGLISSSWAIQTLFFGVIPALLTLRYFPKTESFKPELYSRLWLSGLVMLVLVGILGVNYSEFREFVREDKVTRQYANPIYPIYSLVKYTASKMTSFSNHSLQVVLTDVVTGTRSKPRIVILVVGESARADRFALNGYTRNTNPELSKLDVISFRNVTSCGTSTGESLPCMFSLLPRSEFSRERAGKMENALDILVKSGVAVLWRDNNSDSKGVATRVTYQDFKTPAYNPLCDRECRDLGMLSGLNEYVSKHAGSDMLIVLHQMGNHGPEYYRRYPKEFERFSPTCKESTVRSCSKVELDNAYDNAILYTDHFLATTVSFLDRLGDKFQTAMFYVSDHGESLGENGVFLHAAPYDRAPAEQKRIPALLWVGKELRPAYAKLRLLRDESFSHDDLFCALLTGFDRHTSVCTDWSRRFHRLYNAGLYSSAKQPPSQS